MLKSPACFIFLMLMMCVPLRAQENEVAQAKETVPFWKRISFHTNAVDWVLTVPNFGVEFDLQNTEETRFSILFNGKFNGNTKHTVNPRLVWNVQSGAMEVRKYWRTSEIGAGARGKQSERDTTVFWLRGVFAKFRHNVLSGRTMKKPRYWRAYYVGFHGSLDKFTYCLGKKGKQGRGINAGISGGYSIPLYPFKNGKSIDLDLGAVVVAKMVQYDTFRYEEESACYAYTGTKGKHIVPYPVLHDVHVSLVYRFNSIANKVQGEAKRYEVKRDSMQAIQSRRGKAQESRWYDRYNTKMNSLRQKDSVRAANRVRDSLERVSKEAEKLYKKMVKDSLENEKLKRKMFGAVSGDTVIIADSVRVEAVESSEKDLERADTLQVDSVQWEPEEREETLLPDSVEVDREEPLVEEDSVEVQPMEVDQTFDLLEETSDSLATDDVTIDEEIEPAVEEEEEPILEEPKDSVEVEEDLEVIPMVPLEPIEESDTTAVEEDTIETDSVIVQWDGMWIRPKQRLVRDAMLCDAEDKRSEMNIWIRREEHLFCATKRGKKGGMPA